MYGINPEHDADYIAQTFYVQRLGIVKRIIMVPYVNSYNGETYLSAYIDFHKWNNRSYARHFIKMLKNQPQIYLYHYFNLGWPVSLTDNTDSILNLKNGKIICTNYSQEYYKQINWSEESSTFNLVRAEFIANQCAESVLLDC